MLIHKQLLRPSLVLALVLVVLNPVAHNLVRANVEEVDVVPATTTAPPAGSCNGDGGAPPPAPPTPPQFVELHAHRMYVISTSLLQCTGRCDGGWLSLLARITVYG